MPKYRHRLPQTSGELFVTDGGLETTLIFHHGITLPEFAAFVLMQDDTGVDTLQRYYREYGTLAQRYGVGFLFDSPTWRASRDWGQRLGFSEQALADLNRRSIELLMGIRDSSETHATRGVISGCIGPRADGYVPSRRMSSEEAAEYHLPQVRTFSQTEADMISVLTLNYVEEAIGVTLAARSVGMPVAISFTVETDGTLPTGDTLKEAIERTDDATAAFPAYYMINCAHPTHFRQSLDLAGTWLSRVRGLRANASQKSHAELNDATELDDGDPRSFGTDYRRLKARLPQLSVLGGCCGTDKRHIEAICKAVLE
ncbi:MAG: homocysteine S-methyltransferase [Deltaproteobacteria bacterium]|nr:homocysteine S-methyltransferase [Deltaproteobacteria bacterium]